MLNLPDFFLILSWGIFDTFFFKLPFAFFCHTASYGTFRSAVFSIPISLFLCLLRWCDGAPGHFPRPPTPIPPHIHRHTQYNIYTPMGAFSRRDSNGIRTRADLAVVAERVLILPSTTLPSAPRRHTHTSMARRRFLPLKKSSPSVDSNPLASGPRPRSTFSDSHAATEPPDFWY
jgi:hypothetical protein